MVAALCIVGAAFAALVLLVWFVEIRTTIRLVINRGGLWASYETGVNQYRVVGFWIRLMSGHQPRAWMRIPFTPRRKEADYGKTIRAVTEPKWKPLQVPLISVLDIGLSLQVKELDLMTKIGIEGDAVATALLCGSAGAAAHAIRAAATRGKYVPKGRIIITPSFSQSSFRLSMKCIVGIKARHIIREIAKSMLRRKF